MKYWAYFMPKKWKSETDKLKLSLFQTIYFLYAQKSNFGTARIQYNLINKKEFIPLLNIGKNHFPK